MAPIAVGLILGEMVETNLQNSLKMFDGQVVDDFNTAIGCVFSLFLPFLGLCGPYIYKLITTQKS